MRIRVAAGAVLVMFLWAVCFPLIRVGLEASPPMWFAGLRAFLAGGMLIVLAWLARRPPIRGTPVWSRVALVGLTATSLGFFGMFYGGGLVSPGLATVVGNTQPLLAAPLAWVALGEHLRPVQRVGLTAGFLGIVLIGAPGIAVPQQTVGVIYILLGAVGVAVGNVVLKRLAGQVDVLWAMGWQLTIGSVPLILLGMAIEDAGGIVWNVRFIASLLLLSVFGTSVAFALWFWLLHYVMLNHVNAFTFLTPIFGLGLGALFFDESLGVTAMLGSALGIVGVYAVSRGAKVIRTNAAAVAVPAKAVRHD